MGIHEINIPNKHAVRAESPLVNPLLLRSYGDGINPARCRESWAFQQNPKSTILDQHKQAPRLKGRWPTSPQLILLRDPNLITQKELLTKSPWQIQNKRKLTKEEELNRVRKRLEDSRDSAKRKSQLVNQQTFDNWLKGKIKARKEEALAHLTRLKLEEDRKSLFAEYIERKNIEEVEKWLMDKMSIVEETIDTKKMSAEMQKWYAAQKESMKEKLLKLWGYQFHRPLPKVDARRCPKYLGYVTPQAKWSSKHDKQKISTNKDKDDHQVQFV